MKLRILLLNLTAVLLLSACGGGGGGSAKKPSITSFKAELAQVREGQATELRWASEHAESCQMNGATVATSGRQSTGALRASTAYELRCTGGNQTVSAQTRVDILAAGWTALNPMPQSVAKFGAAALNGKIYVIGGYDTLRSVQIYDIASNSWQVGPVLPRGTDNVAVLAAGGKIYALGGEARNAVQIYDPASNGWTPGPVLPAIRFAASAEVLDGRLHLVGGWNYDNNQTGSLTSHVAFEPSTQRYVDLAPLTTARNAAASGVLGGRLHVVGGRAPGIRFNDATALASMEIYDPATNTWSAGSALPQARSSMASAALNGRLYLFGGEQPNPQVHGEAQRFDPATGQWQSLGQMPYAAHGLAAVTVGEAIYVMGGFAGASDAVGTETAALYRYDPQN